MKIKDLFGLLKETLFEWYASNTFQLGAALAYYSVFAIAPTLVLALSIAGRIFGAEAAAGHLEARLGEVAGPTVAAAIEETLSYVHASGETRFATLASLTALLFGAIGAFTQLQAALNAIWGVMPKPGRSIWRVVADRFISFLIVLCVGILLVLSLATSTALVVLSSYFPPAGLPGSLHFWRALHWLITFALLTLLFAVIFRMLPDVKIAWRDVWIGAATTSTLFTVGNYPIGLYLGRSSVSSAYGAAGSVIIVLLWVYYSSQIVLLGAEFTKVYARRSGHPLIPAAHAICLTPEQRVRLGMSSDSHLAHSATK